MALYNGGGFGSCAKPIPDRGSLSSLRWKEVEVASDGKSTTPHNTGVTRICDSLIV